MQVADESTVLGNFDGARFRNFGVTSEFFRRDGKFMVRTDGPDGKLADFEVRHTFGVYPLQQYLIELPGGHVQALSIAWDTRTKDQGGQRWFHLYPNERIDLRDELHWTQRQQNWNFMCSDCHSTNVQKNYDAAEHTFATTFSEISVGCEACHGPGSVHVGLARAAATSGQPMPNSGLTVNLGERRGAAWVIDPATGNAARSTPRTTERELDVCAQCHARRGQFSNDYRAGEPLQDHYLPALLSEGLYHPDGQQRDEVFNWGSFVSSRMYAKGVTCGDCHDPHGGQLHAPGNGVCAQCHSAAEIRRGQPSLPRARDAGCRLCLVPHEDRDLHGRRSAARPQLPDTATRPQRESRRAERLQPVPHGSQGRLGCGRDPQALSGTETRIPGICGRFCRSGPPGCCREHRADAGGCESRRVGHRARVGDRTTDPSSRREYDPRGRGRAQGSEPIGSARGHRGIRGPAAAATPCRDAVAQ